MRNYLQMTDEELITEAQFSEDPLVKALAEALAHAVDHGTAIRGELQEARRERERLWRASYTAPIPDQATA